MIYGGIASIWNDTLGVFQFVELVPHLPGIANDDRHTGINDNIVGSMKISDTLVRVDHGQPRLALIACIEIINDLFGIFRFELGTNNFKDRGQSVVWVGANLC